MSIQDLQNRLQRRMNTHAETPWRARDVRTTLHSDWNGHAFNANAQLLQHLLALITCGLYDFAAAQNGSGAGARRLRRKNWVGRLGSVGLRYCEDTASDKEKRNGYGREKIHVVSFRSRRGMGEKERFRLRRNALALICCQRTKNNLA